MRPRMTMPDGTVVAVRTTTPAQGVTPRGIVHILHGMAEHAGRYDRFASELAGCGYVAVAHDHRGHGDTSPDSLGHLADHDGWALLVDDALRVGAAAREEYWGLPYVLLGHSMGSLVARTLVQEHSDTVDALILSGAVADAGRATRLGGLVLARGLSRLTGGATPSPLLDRLSFGAFNKPFGGRTPFDWLSRDDAAVDAYIADPRCGFVCSHRFFADLIGGMALVTDKARTAGVRPDLPVLLLAGGRDPVAREGSALSEAAIAYRRAGLRDVTTRIYDGARHELLNEINRDEVVGDVVTWLQDRVGRDDATVIPLRRKHPDERRSEPRG